MSRGIDPLGAARARPLARDRARARRLIRYGKCGMYPEFGIDDKDTVTPMLRPYRAPLGTDDFYEFGHKKQCDDCGRALCRVAARGVRRTSARKSVNGIRAIFGATRSGARVASCGSKSLASAVIHSRQIVRHAATAPTSVGKRLIAIAQLQDESSGTCRRFRARAR